MHDSLSRPVLIAPFAAASQLEPTFNLGGPSASADTIGEPSGMTASTIVAAKAKAASFTWGCLWIPVPGRGVIIRYSQIAGGAGPSSTHPPRAELRPSRGPYLE